MSAFDFFMLNIFIKASFSNTEGNFIFIIYIYQYIIIIHIPK